MNAVSSRPVTAATAAVATAGGRGDASGGGGGGVGVSRDGKVSAGGRKFDVRGGGGSQSDWQGVRTKGKEGVRGPKALGVAAGGERFGFGFEFETGV